MPNKAIKKKTASASRPEEFWELRLYVAGQTPKSVVAFRNLKKLCEEHLAGKYRIEVVDLIKNPQLAKGDQIVAIPTLVRKLPVPIRTRRRNSPATLDAGKSTALASGS